MTKNIPFSLSNFIGDGTGFITGYTSSDPDSTILSHVGNIVQHAVPVVTQPVVDEIVKAFAGLVLAVASRIIFARVDKWMEKRKERKKNKAAKVEK